MTTNAPSHPIFAEVTALLDDQSIDVAAVWATGFNREWRHYIITDDGEVKLISDHDHDVLNEYDAALRVAYRELGLLLAPARAARKSAAIQARLANARPTITAADAARIQAEWQRIAIATAAVIARRA
jgi:hypothetical protein